MNRINSELILTTILSTLTIVSLGIVSCQPEATKVPITEELGTTWEAGLPVPKTVVRSTRAFRERLLSDPHRPAYHFVIPEDFGSAMDPNGAFYHNGRYHLMYLYRREGSGGAGHSWGHVSSADLLHWRHHPDALVPSQELVEILSGGAFVDQEGNATVTYWEYIADEAKRNEVLKSGSLGIGIARSSDEHFDTWTKSPSNPVIKSNPFGITMVKDQDGPEIVAGSMDPTNIWVKDGRYYMAAGNGQVLWAYGREADAPSEFKGDHLYLYASDDLNTWEYIHEFYERDPDWTEDNEDNSCPSFLPLPSSPDGGEASGKHLLLFISHNKGCQYYIGTYRDDKFYSEKHGRMSWEDRDYFAPEALIDKVGRQIMWAWIKERNTDDIRKNWDRNYYGWVGTYSLPRSLWLGEDGTLRMRPVKELAGLRYNKKERNDITIEADSEIELADFGTELMELEITLDPGEVDQAGVVVGVSEDGREQTTIFYDASSTELVLDANQSGIDSEWENLERAPFELKTGESLVLRVFVDKSVIEVFANDRQAIGRQVFPKLGGRGVKLFAKGGEAQVAIVRAWEMMPSNPY